MPWCPATFDDIHPGDLIRLDMSPLFLVDAVIDPRPNGASLIDSLGLPHEVRAGQLVERWSEPE